MESSEQRFYVKNLPPSIGEEDVKSYFSGIGEIFDVSVKNNYGFFSVKGSSKRLDKVVSKYTEKEWNGNVIKLEKAEKENFMTRLAKERAASLAEKITSLENSPVNGATSESPRKKKKFRKKHQSDSESSEDGGVKAGIPKFGGTMTLSSESIKTSVPAKVNVEVNTTMSDFAAFDSMWADDETPASTSQELSSILGRSNPSTSAAKKVKEKATNETKERTGPLTKIEKKQRDDERRRQSLKDKAREKQKQQSAIKSALSTLDGPKPKKIVFDSDGEGEDEGRGKTMLFDEDEHEEEHFCIPDKDHYEGEKGHKLLKLQTQFNNDDRFKMNERFLEDDGDDLEGAAKSKINRPVEMIRFDPSRPAEDKTVHELKPRGSVKKADPTPAPVVSKEKFYEVSDSIKSALKEKSPGFSLLATYGGKSKEPSETESPRETKIRPIVKRNPLLEDSSDDDMDNDYNMEEPPKIWAPVVNVPSGPRDNFFFSVDDPLIAEAMEFMNKKNSDEAKAAAENYDATRGVLRKIFKQQTMKHAKKTDMFKKKVGGMKKRPVAKMNQFGPRTQKNGNFKNNYKRQ